MNILILVLLMIIIFGIVYYYHKNYAIPLSISLGCMILFLLMISHSAYSNDKLTFEVIGLSALIIGMTANMYIQNRKKVETSVE